MDDCKSVLWLVFLLGHVARYLMWICMNYLDLDLALPSLLLSDYIDLSCHNTTVVPVATIVLFEESTLFTFKDGHGQVQLTVQLICHTPTQQSWFCIFDCVPYFCQRAWHAKSGPRYMQYICSRCAPNLIVIWSSTIDFVKKAAATVLPWGRYLKEQVGI